MKNKSRIALFLALVWVLVLSGCIKARVSIKVENDGSGTLAMAVGMSQEIKALASSSGQDPMDELEKELAQEIDREVTVRRWEDDDYDWVENSVAFQDADDLEKLVQDAEIFERFSLQHEKGLFKHRFELDATVEQLSGGQDMPDDLPLDASDLFDIRVAVELPGNVVETNGTYEGDSQVMTWKMSGQESIQIHAVSEVWNWTTLLILAALLLLLGIGFLIVLGVGAFFLLRRKKAPAR